MIRRLSVFAGTQVCRARTEVHGSRVWWTGCWQGLSRFRSNRLQAGGLALCPGASGNGRDQREGSPFGSRGICSGKGSSQRASSLEDVASLVRNKECQRIVVMAGAGISTASGIPDFRSPGSGLYDNLQTYDIPYPEAIFEIDYFHCNPKPFFVLAKELYPGSCWPNFTHYFVRLLHQKGILLRMYTQNIDGLERMAGIPPEKLVEAHGTFATATCTVCLKAYSWEELRDDVMQSKVPQCATCSGVIKPDIVFFGEQLPQKFDLHMLDLPLADLLVIMGTSLEVEPFASLSGMVRGSVPRVLINQDLVGSFVRNPPRGGDVTELGDIVRGVERFAELLGWKQEVNDLLQREHKQLKITYTDVHPSRH
uniref:Deacetylase sirtuin-type domain-containing protein n=1 Tax=Callorhinchus milii TaxID=7868 RepID=A0A4W3HM86_CALMI|eukprot:gi/632986172/ref/XP_007910087.1/ PREDICTED: NAD-dependent protein deacetylase sirtuin-3, mitochondrial [Callorhinchus milii]